MMTPITNSGIQSSPLLLPHEQPDDPIEILDDLPGPADNTVAKTISCTKFFFDNRGKIALAAKVTCTLAFTATLISSFTLVYPDPKVVQIAQISGVSCFLLTSISIFVYFLSKNQEVIDR